MNTLHVNELQAGVWFSWQTACPACIIFWALFLALQNLGLVAHACNPNIPGRKEDWELMVILGYLSSTAAVRPCLFVFFFSFFVVNQAFRTEASTLHIYRENICEIQMSQVRSQSSSCKPCPVVACTPCHPVPSKCRSPGVLPDTAPSLACPITNSGPTLSLPISASCLVCGL